MQYQAVLVPLLILILSALTVKADLLNKSAALSGAIVANLIWLGTGLSGLILLAIFFVCGAGATRLVRQGKRLPGPDRKASQVWANGGVAALAGLLSFLTADHPDFFLLLVAAAFSSGTGDTLSSELGTRFGKRFINIISFQPDKRGADGVISGEGFMFGLMGSGLIAFACFLLDLSIRSSLYVLFAGVLGNLADSYFGALWQRKGYLSNDFVNLLNTLVAVICIILLILAF